MYAQLLKITEMQALVSPTAANYVIPKKLDVCILLDLRSALMFPSIRLMSILSAR